MSGLPRFLAGERLLIEEPVRDLGQLRRGSRVVVTVSLFNPAFSPVVVAESRSGCGCTVAQKLPLSVAPRAIRELEIALEVSQPVGPFLQRLRLHSAGGARIAAEIVLSGVVVE